MLVSTLPPLYVTVVVFFPIIVKLLLFLRSFIAGTRIWGRLLFVLLEAVDVAAPGYLCC